MFVELIDEGEEEDDQLVDFVLLHLAITQAGDSLGTDLKKEIILMKLRRRTIKNVIED